MNEDAKTSGGWQVGSGAPTALRGPCSNCFGIVGGRSFQTMTLGGKTSLN